MGQPRGVFVYFAILTSVCFVTVLASDRSLRQDYRRQFYSEGEKRKLKTRLPLFNMSNADDTVPGQFIIGLKHLNLSHDQIANVTDRLSKEFGCVVKSHFTIGAFHALHVHADNEDAAKRALLIPEVEFVEPDKVVRSSADQCAPEVTGRQLWGLSRTGQRDSIANDQSSNSLTYSTSPKTDGQNVYAYVVDTGILTTHVEFNNGRASWGMTASSLNEQDEDLNGHGTHVSGTIGGETVGVAKDVNLIAVKVLDAQGQGTTTSLLQGLQWVVSDHQKKNNPRALCNLSLGFNGRSQSVDNAVAQAVAAGLSMVLAAGNSDIDACTTSPLASTAIKVAAANYTDELASFSNWGTCVDIAAPGVGILSSYSLSDVSYAVASGTSMSAPHVSGSLARFLGSQSTVPTPADAKSWVLKAATSGALSMSSEADSTPNLLLYMNCESMSTASTVQDVSQASTLSTSTLLATGLCCLTSTMNLPAGADQAASLASIIRFSAALITGISLATFSVLKA